MKAKTMLHLKKRDQRGFSHVELLVAIIFIGIIAFIGVRVLSASHADSKQGSIIGVAGKCLDNANGKAVNSNPIDLRTCNSGAAQAWTVKSNGTIVNSNGYCLAVAGAGTTSGTIVHLYTCDGGPAQLWTVSTTAGTIVNPHSGLCLDDKWSVTTDGNPIWVYTCNGTTAQKWTVPPSAAVTSQNSTTSTTTTTTQTTNASTTGFVTASGTHFVYNGSPFRFIGYNAYGMEGCYNGSIWTTAQLDAYFSSLPANGVTRLWAFQSYGTTPLTQIATEAAKYNQHLIFVLGDDDSYCGETDGSVSGNASGKTLAFYQSGWQGKYLSWVNTVVPIFKNNTAVMMWEVANEPGQAGAKPTLAQWQTYLQGTSDAIRAADPNHLISVGSNTAGNFGGSSNFTSLMGLPNINAISFHDYSYEYENGATVSGNFNTAKQASTQNNKPFYAGEAGVPSGSTCSNSNYTTLSLASRTSFLQNKANNYLANGGSGILFWEAEPTQASWVASCAYEIYPSDPLTSIVHNYKLP